MVTEFAAALESVAKDFGELARRGIEGMGKSLTDLCDAPAVQARLDNVELGGGESALHRDAQAPRDVKASSPFSDEVTDQIRSMDELSVYKEAGLCERTIDGRTCLVRDDIDWDAVDVDGRTNIERAEQGLAPIDAQGRPYELHHIGQKPDSPLAELTFEEHRGKNMSVLHDSEACEIDRNHYNNVEKPEHWKARAAENAQVTQEVHG